MVPDWMLPVDEYAPRFYNRKADEYLYAMRQYRGSKQSPRFQKLKKAEQLCRHWAAGATIYDLGILGEELVVEHREMISRAIEQGRPVPDRVKEDLWRR